MYAEQLAMRLMAAMSQSHAMRKALGVLAAWTLSCTWANAEVIATCGPSEGHAYYPITAPNQKDSGWRKEALPEGFFQLIRTGEEYDVLVSDDKGELQSARAKGGQVSLTGDDSGHLVVLVFYEGKALDTYVFWVPVAGKATVTYSQSRFGEAVAKQSLLRASCKWS